jgi:hypothetical protein
MRRDVSLGLRENEKQEMGMVNALVDCKVYVGDGTGCWYRYKPTLEGYSYSAM